MRLLTDSAAASAHRVPVEGGCSNIAAAIEVQSNGVYTDYVMEA